MPVKSSTGVSKTKKVPPWWKGDEAAAATSMQAARDLGYVVGTSV